jgi:polysaccharide biosynthesis/export protein
MSHRGRSQIRSGRLAAALGVAFVLSIVAAARAADSLPVPLASSVTPSASATNGHQFDLTRDTASGAQPARKGTDSTNTTTFLPVRNMASLDDKQRLAIGDRVIIRVVEDQEDPKTLTVTDAGELDVPELGLVTAVGKTCRELAFEIKTKLEQVTYYHATVIIGLDLLNKTTSGRKLYVVGQVRVTGPQEIPAGETMTVGRAIMKAGGFTDFADRKRVRLVRGGAKGQPGQTFTINIMEVLEKGRTEKDLPVEPEDLIYVPTRAVNIF